MEKLGWLKNHFLDKYQCGPFVVEKDVDYYDDLSKRFKKLIKSAKDSGADTESIDLLVKYTKKILQSIELYYDAEIVKSYNTILKLVKDCAQNDLALSTLENSYSFFGERNKNIQFFRARLGDNAYPYKGKEMLHIPFSKRGRTVNNRFGLPGIPSLYLSNTSYGCWIELGMPPEYKFNVSPVEVEETLKIFNLAVSTRIWAFLDELDKDRVHCWLKLIVLMIATSYKIKEKGRSFKSEYIVSQNIMLACRKLGIDGVAYFSKQVSDELFAICAVNLVLFAPYNQSEEYSKALCEHIKIGDSFNYMLYKQLGAVEKHCEYDLRIKRTGIVTNIGDYKWQFPYQNTEFYEFDKFLFSNWKEKDKIKWGNALI